jgi:signal transduction histidine kinase
MSDRTARTLLKFSQLVASAEDPEAVASLLVDTAVEILGADAAVVFELRDDSRLVVAASRGAPEDIVQLEYDGDTIGGELAQLLEARLDRRFGQVAVLPMVSGRDLFGALVLLAAPGKVMDTEQLELANGLSDLVATLLSSNAKLAALRRAHEELLASQALLVRNERLRALGQMAAGIAHDLKNVLNPLSLYLGVINQAAAKGDLARVPQTVERVRDVLRTGTRTIERLRDFSRNQPETTHEVVNLDAIASEAIELARPRMSSAGAVSQIEARLGQPPTVSARAGDLIPCVLNLLVNAIDAMPKGGHIVVRTSLDQAGALLEVTDDGPGIPQEVADHVFEPFFTTKGDAGTGLGLAMVTSCAERYGGRVLLRTAPGEGTTVGLWFPAAGEEPSS